MWKCLLPIVDAFLLLDDCAWQYSSMGELIGLDGIAAGNILDRCGIHLKPSQFKLFMLFAKTVASELRKRTKK